MSRSILVLGVPRSGTSAVAGALHALGVDMGTGHLQKGNEWNERGYYEDLRWQKLNKRITGDRYGTNHPAAIGNGLVEAYQRLIEECEQSPLWGVKDPRLCFTARFIWPMLREPRMVVVHRAPSASAESLMHHSRGNYGGKHAMTLEEAMSVRDTWQEAMNDTVFGFPGPKFIIRFEELLDQPRQVVEQLATFCFDGLSLMPDVKAGQWFIDPNLRHCA